MPLTAKQLTQADNLQTEVVDVPEWARDGECKVLIRAMSGLAMSRYQSRLRMAVEGERDEDDAMLMIQDRTMLEYVAASIIDPDTGELVFDTPEATGILAQKNGKGLRRVFDAASKLNLDSAEASEDFRKNSNETPAGSSGGSTPSKKDTDTPTP